MWEGAPQASYGVAATRLQSTRATYQAAVPPEIAERTPVPSRDVAEAAEEAARELTRFDAELGGAVAAFAPVLLRSEAASSSQIEQLTASARAILTAEYGATGSRNATLIASNTKALHAALELADEVSTGSMLRMHEALMEHQPAHTPGRFRQEPVWIGSSGSSPVGAHYVGPRHELVPALVDDLASFSARTDLPALTQVAVAHAQFETIHPFTDGNGRTGRALAQSLLRYRGVTRNVAVPVSAGLLATTSEYHAALDAYREGDVDPIVLMFADASTRAIANSRRLVGDIEEVKDGWRSSVKARAGSGARALLDVIARRPVLDAKTAAAEIGVATRNVYPALALLEDQGVLRKKQEHRVGMFWRSDEILTAVDAFAERAGRRTWS